MMNQHLTYNQRRYVNEWLLVRAHVTNTQLGQEEQSGGVRLTVTGGDNDGVDVPVRIVVAPKDTQVVRGNPVTELHCIANTRSVFFSRNFKNSFCISWN